MEMLDFALATFKALAVIFLTIILCLPLGSCFLKLFRINCHPHSKLSIAFALGLISQALVVFCIHYFQLQALAYAYNYLALAPLIFLIFSKTNFGFLRFIVFFVFASLLLVHLIIFPKTKIEDVSPESTRTINGYYSDNLLTFNTARIFTEGRNVNHTIIVPVWTFFDRTPLAGALIAYLWFFLGIKESANWLASSGENFFYYQAQIIFLNILSLLALACFLQRNSRRTLLTMFIFVIAPFLMLNLSFAWPKFLSAFFVIVGLDLISFSSRNNVKLKEFFIAGLLIGFGYLTHDSAIFFIAMLMLTLLLLAIFSEQLNLKQFLGTCFGLVFAILPWFVFRFYNETKSSHMLALHLLCVTDFSYQNLNFKQALDSYLSTHSFGQLAKVKLGNILYPFSIIEFFKSLKNGYFDLFEWLRIMAILSKYQLIHAIGLPAFLIAICGLFKWKSYKEINWWFALIGLVSVLPAALLFGCEKSTWNHSWAYLPILLLALPLSYLVEKSILAYSLIVVSTMSISLELLDIQANFFSVASESYLIWAGILTSILFILTFLLQSSLNRNVS